MSGLKIPRGAYSVVKMYDSFDVVTTDEDGDLRLIVSVSSEDELGEVQDAEAIANAIAAIPGMIDALEKAQLAMRQYENLLSKVDPKWNGQLITNWSYPAGIDAEHQCGIVLAKVRGEEQS